MAKKDTNKNITIAEVLTKLQAKAHPDQLAGMQRYGMTIEKRLGISMPDLRQIAREIGKNHALALELWQTGIAEARIIAGMVAEADKLTEEEMESWVKDINSWDVCDQTCDNLFEKSPLADKKIRDWSQRDEEFVKRTAFSLIACLAWHDKKREDSRFLPVLEIIKQCATDERNFVKKAVNWALRNIGKRSLFLNRAALETAREIQQLDSKAARWIAADAIRELKSAAVQKRLQK